MKNRNQWPYPGETVTRGEVGNHVRAWQDRLVESGYLENATGVHDAETAKALRDLRKDLEYKTPSEGKGEKQVFLEPEDGATEGLWEAWKAHPTL